MLSVSMGCPYLFNIEVYADWAEVVADRLADLGIIIMNEFINDPISIKAKVECIAAGGNV